MIPQTIFSFKLETTKEKFRWKMAQVAGRIVKHAGEIILKLSIDIEQLELFKGIRKKIYEVCLCTDN